MPCKDKKNNKPEEETNSESTVDRIYHDSETFLFRYRWWIVLFLAVLLGYYLYSKRTEKTGSGESTGASSDLAVGGPKLGPNELNIGEPSSQLNTEARKLFRL
ncbi:hypothetical protein YASMINEVIRUS_980 [Yasminevirus sp. GU-2018]|uniref:Uncharacterized protein n=1 Tax=Yasminevirus sp. GU-2018 TaxID=2420051 RepID=A0A5K0U988_9VIRU|nr:hypothetical protein YASMINEVIRUS_980 [Yasminevirus sp. GU-2018]